MSIILMFPTAEDYYMSLSLVWHSEKRGLYLQWNFPMSPHFRLSAGLSVIVSVIISQSVGIFTSILLSEHFINYGYYYSYVLAVVLGLIPPVFFRLPVEHWEPSWRGACSQPNRTRWAFLVLLLTTSFYTSTIYIILIYLPSWSGATYFVI